MNEKNGTVGNINIATPDWWPPERRRAFLHERAKYMKAGIMSYARLSDDSDVYVYAFNATKHRHAFHCQGCRLAPAWDFYAYSYADIIRHLQKHLGAGHKVPSEAFQRLIDEEMHEIDDVGSRARIIAVTIAALAGVLAVIYRLCWL